MDTPENAGAMTLSEAAEHIAYCYYCQCGFRERVNLTRIAADFPLETRVRDLLSLLPCGHCASTKKTIMTLWLRATTTDQMLRERGFPVWQDE